MDGHIPHPPCTTEKKKNLPVCTGATKSIILAFKIDTQTDLLPGKQRAPLAFKNSMTHGLLQFALRIAFCCVLHRYGSQDILRHEFYEIVHFYFHIHYR